MLRKIEAVLSLGDAERAFVARLETDTRRIEARADLVKQGERAGRMGVLRSGWAMRYKTLSDGRRHVINFVLPGDAFGLFGTLFDASDHSVAMLTDGELAYVEADTLVAMFHEHPKLAAAFAWFAAREEAMLAERAAGLGRRTALERMAHILLELLKRLEVVAMADDGRFELPVTQEILADTLGLSLVHVNRTLRRLREGGLLETEGQRFWLRDLRALAEVADFDDLYLLLTRMPKRVLRRFETA
ncbi:MAG TPA: Crp/Fnr family transcriptional regulator [Azospirillaceae bacterium]|nr:Crp/Fnr family transcriptional regulator [Azospirillaceae bacterium]